MQLLQTFTTDEDYYDPEEVLRQQVELEEEIQVATCHAIATQYMEEGNISRTTCLRIEAEVERQFSEEVTSLSSYSEVTGPTKGHRMEQSRDSASSTSDDTDSDDSREEGWSDMGDTRPSHIEEKDESDVSAGPEWTQAEPNLEYTTWDTNHRHISNMDTMETWIEMEPQPYQRA